MQLSQCGPEGRLGGEEAAEAVDAGAGGRGGGAEEEGGVRGRVEAGGGAEERLHEGHGAAGDVAADVVGVVPLDVGRSELAAGENAIAKAGGEPLDLPLDRVGPIDGRSG